MKYIQGNNRNLINLFAVLQSITKEIGRLILSGERTSLQETSGNSLTSVWNNETAIWIKLYPCEKGYKAGECRCGINVYCI